MKTYNNKLIAVSLSLLTSVFYGCGNENLVSNRPNSGLGKFAEKDGIAKTENSVNAQLIEMIQSLTAQLKDANEAAGKAESNYRENPTDEGYEELVGSQEALTEKTFSKLLEANKKLNKKIAYFECKDYETLRAIEISVERIEEESRDSQIKENIKNIADGMQKGIFKLNTLRSVNIYLAALSVFDQFNAKVDKKKGESKVGYLKKAQEILKGMKSTKITTKNIQKLSDKIIELLAGNTEESGSKRYIRLANEVLREEVKNATGLKINFDEIITSKETTTNEQSTEKDGTQKSSDFRKSFKNVFSTRSSLFISQYLIKCEKTDGKPATIATLLNGHSAQQLKNRDEKLYNAIVDAVKERCEESIQALSKKLPEGFNMSKDLISEALSKKQTYKNNEYGIYFAELDRVSELDKDDFDMFKKGEDATFDFDESLQIDEESENNGTCFVEQYYPIYNLLKALGINPSKDASAMKKRYLTMAGVEKKKAEKLAKKEAKEAEKKAKKEAENTENTNVGSVEAVELS